MPSGENALANKCAGALYLDKELVEKSKELGLNLSKNLKTLKTLNNSILNLTFVDNLIS